jgi:hypothetical protein
MEGGNIPPTADLDPKHLLTGVLLQESPLACLPLSKQQQQQQQQRGDNGAASSMMSNEDGNLQQHWRH